MWRRDPPPDPMARHGLRPLTWRDGLRWRRVGDGLAVTALWIGVVLWLLAGLYDIGFGTVVVVTWIGWGLGFPAVCIWRQDADVPRWPRRAEAAEGPSRWRVAEVLAGIALAAAMGVWPALGWRYDIGPYVVAGVVVVLCIRAAADMADPPRRRTD